MGSPISTAPSGNRASPIPLQTSDSLGNPRPNVFDVDVEAAENPLEPPPLPRAMRAGACVIFLSET